MKIATIVLFILLSIPSSRNLLLETNSTSNSSSRHLTEPPIHSLNQWIKLKNNQSIDDYTRRNDSIFCGEIYCSPKPMKNVDINSFEVCPGSSYARDKNNIYYPINKVCIDYTNCGVCYCSKYIITDVQTDQFVYLGKDYATDRRKVFFRGNEIPEADGRTFKVIDGPKFFYFAVDKNKVYRHNSHFTLAEPNTFYYDSTDSRNDTIVNNYIIGDKKHEWMYFPPKTVKRVKKAVTVQIRICITRLYYYK